MPTDFLKILKNISLTCLKKEDGDIAEVQAIIRLLTPLMLTYWGQLVKRALEDLLDFLKQLDDEIPLPEIDALLQEPRKKELLAELVLAMFLLVESRITSPPSRALQGALRAGIASLLQDGARKLGFEFKTATAEGSLFPRAAEADLLLLLRGKLSQARPELLKHFEEFLTNRAARNAATGVQVAGQINSLEEWVRETRNILSITGETFIPQIVDMWAYRWFNIGAISGGIQNDVLFFIARNPLDNRTTPFCRWVSGKVVSVQKAEEQITEFIKAVNSGNLDEATALWPMVNMSKVKTVGDFQRVFAQVGLPPYHWRCRTIVEIVLGAPA